MSQPLVLLVDDESNVRSALVRMLRQESYEIVTANSADAAKHFLQRHPIDLIVTDNQMANTKGIELLRWVRAFDFEIVRIMLSGKMDSHELTLALQDATIHHFFSKPCNIDELARTIRQELAR